MTILTREVQPISPTVVGMRLARAKRVREALEVLAAEAHASGHYREAACYDGLVEMAPPDRLSRLVGLLR